MGQPRWATKAGRTTFSRPIVAVAAIGVLMVLLVLLRHLDDDGSSSTPAPGGPLPAAAAPCVAGGVDCPAPPLQLCLDARGARVDCSAVLADTSAPSSTSGWDWLLIAVVVIAPFALVLGPLGWRAVCRTRRRNREAFDAGLPDLLERGFVLADDPRPERFAVQQACQRSQRVLVREGDPTMWLLERERTMSSVREAWPVRSAVVELTAPVPVLRLIPVAADNQGTRRYRTVGGNDGSDLLQDLLRLLADAHPDVIVLTAGDLLEVHTPPGGKQWFEALPEPLGLSAVADLAEAIAATLVAHAGEPSA